MFCVFSHVVSNLYMSLMGPVDLKKKYKATWALVTGAGSGIGKSLAETLAKQGLNVVLVSLPDKFLDDTYDELKKAYPNVEFRKVPAKFDHKTDYMPGIIEATKDIDVPIIFNNAGYIVTGFFDTTTLDAQLANMECNATSCVKVTHHFVQQMLRKNLKGCVVFTSSVSGYLPNPFAVMYGATKAFVSQFAASLAIELRASGIDVVAVHPSPVASNFFANAHKLDSLEIAKKSAVAPSSVPELILTSVGRAHLADLGQFAVIVRGVVAVLPYDFLTTLFALGAPFMGDFQKHNKNRGGKKD
ncbi:SDR family NAD(P)-dependent oxidoreductase [archaeon]|nr:MAG: SDR family NAD(P)-dependent oxidoreductase [archaeon]